MKNEKFNWVRKEGIKVTFNGEIGMYLRESSNKKVNGKVGGVLV